LIDALTRRDHLQFSDVVRVLLQGLPGAITKSGKAGSGVREAPFHGGLFAVLRFAVPWSLAFVEAEYPSQDGRADVVIKFAPGGGAVQAVWIVELGVGQPSSVEEKLAQAARY